MTLGIVLLMMAILWWRYCDLEERWYNTCHIVGLSSRTRPAKVYARLTELVEMENHEKT